MGKGVVRRRRKYIICPICKEKFRFNSEYVSHMTSKHGAYLLPISSVHLMELQKVLLDCTFRCKDIKVSEELINTLLIGKMVMYEEK